MEAKSSGVRLGLFPLPLQGHMNPMLDLAYILHSKGFSITIIHTKLNSPNPSNHPSFSFVSIADGLSEEEASTKDVLSLLSLLNLNCAKPFEECLRVISASEEPISCLISDAVFHFTRHVSDRLGLPRLVLRTGGVSSFVVFAAFPLLKEKGYLPIQGTYSRAQEPVIEVPPLRVKDLPTVNTRNPEAFYQLVVDMVTSAKTSSGIIWNTFEELERSSLASIKQQFCVPVFLIGPFHKHISNQFSDPTISSSFLEEDRSSIAWLDSQLPKSVVYVSFGSIVATSEATFLKIATGLANSGQPFLWVVRPGSVHGSEWVEPLPTGFLESLGGRGLILKWAPQREVLAHSGVGAFWTHCGWNSTLESICEGVPMICTPSFTDQKVNARFVSHAWRVGVQLEDGEIGSEEIESRIRILIKEREGDDIRERVSMLKAEADNCLKQGGSSHESLEKLVCQLCSI